jgi:hypothetical protein
MVVAAVITAAMSALVVTRDTPQLISQPPPLPMYECFPFQDHGKLFWSCKATDLQRK